MFCAFDVAAAPAAAAAAGAAAVAAATANAAFVVFFPRRASPQGIHQPQHARWAEPVRSRMH